MDESAFRHARDAMAARPCAFEKALLAGACACSMAARHNIAEREAVTCGSSAAREACAALRTLLRSKSAFALKLTQVEGPLPHAKEMKVQCGGLLGVQRSIDPAATPAAAVQAFTSAEAGLSSAAPQGLAAVADVHGLVRAAVEKFGGLANLPYSAIVQSVVAHQIRRRRPQP